MKNQRLIYWLVNDLSPVHRGRALLLGPHGFKVKFFTSLEAIKKELLTKRAGIVFLADDTTEYDNTIHIRTLAELPELKGARLVLTIHNGFENNLSLASGLNYRDFIPLNLPDGQWVKRVKFSCAGKAQPYVQPAGQISMNNISSISIPSRLIWLSDSKVRIECRLSPPVGSKLKLAGALAEALGLKYLSLTVDSCENSHLHHRFSDAIIARWKIPNEAESKFQNLIWQLRAKDTGPSYRAFVAARSAPLRNNLLEKLGRDDFTVSSALQIQSMVMEPKFFTPDIVFIEDSLTSGQHSFRFSSMLEALSPKVPVIIIGNDVNRNTLRSNNPKSRLLFLKKMPENFESGVLNRVMPSLSRGTPNTDLGASHIPPQDSLSYGHLVIPARLTQVHPSALHFSTSFNLGRFGIAKISSPVIKKILGRDPWIKIVDSHRNHRSVAAPFIFSSEAFLMATSITDQGRMSTALAELLQSHFEKFTEPGVQQNISTPQEDRTPEFGSLISSTSDSATHSRKVPPTPSNSRNGLHAAVAPPPLKQPSHSGANRSHFHQAESAVNNQTPSSSPRHNRSMVAIEAINTVYTSASANPDQRDDELALMTKLIGIEPDTAKPNFESIDLRKEENPFPAISVLESEKSKEKPLDDIAIANIPSADFGDKALDVAQTVYVNVTSKSFRNMIMVTAFVSFAIAALLGIFYTLADSNTRSGKIFTESLYNFAPHLQKNQKTPRRGLPTPFQRNQ